MRYQNSWRLGREARPSAMLMVTAGDNGSEGPLAGVPLEVQTSWQCCSRDQSKDISRRCVWVVL